MEIKAPRTYICQQTLKQRMAKYPLLQRLKANSIDLLVWTGIYLFLFIGGSRYDIKASAILSALSIAGMLLITLLAKKVLIPRYLDKGNQFAYVLISSIILIIMTWGTVAFERWLFTHIVVNDFPRNNQLIYPIFKSTILLGAAYFMATIEHSMAKTKEMTQRAAQLEYEKSQMELRFLKSQINPHFLFNALNNIYSMVYTRDENAAESILHLSAMLRYVTDDCLAEKVPVEKEVQYIENFLSFQKMRIGESRNVTFIKQIEQTHALIPPMILQPFIENCFKHSRIEANKEGYIRIELTLRNNTLHLLTENSVAPQIATSKGRTGGVGIANVKQRLELTFPGQYTLHIEQADKQFRSELTLTFNG
ncbi:MAG: sensor histidine kinase [Bacteroidales bacterium]